MNNAIHAVLLLCLWSCNASPQRTQANPADKEHKSVFHKKPGSSNENTFIVDYKATVFYEPDSKQLDSIKLVTDPGIFDGSMHEYEYQIKTAHLTLKKNWPDIQIVDAKNVRYLVFIKKDRSKEIIDLNTFGDAYGMFLFDTQKSPVPVDMTNTEEALYLYFGK